MNEMNMGGARAVRVGALVVLVLLAACAPAPSAGGGSRQPVAESKPAAEPQRTLVMAIRIEPGSVASRALQEAGVALHTSKRLFNGDLMILDERGVAQPYLVESLPQLNSPSWQVFPDGRMETIYRLKPNLTWHDGVPLTAEDFMFSRRVYATPLLGHAGSAPFAQMAEVTAPDERTIVVQWSRPFPGAGELAQNSFPPLPRHILEQAFDGPSDLFANHLYWTREFVGLGPFRMARWEPGAFIEATAFDAHVLGRPKIERLQVRFIGDASTVLANLMSESIHMSADASTDFTQAVTIKKEWAARNAGSVHFHPNQWSAARFQFREGTVNPRSLLDVRVRKAFAHALDKEALNEALYDGDGVIAESMVPVQVDYFATVDRAIPKYPYDLRAVDQYLTQAGFTKGADGNYTHPTEGRLTPEVKGFEIAAFARELSAVASAWRVAGIAVQESAYPFAQAQDNQARTQFTGIFIHPTNVGESALVGHNIIGIPAAENRWTGGNRGGWVNQDYDRLVASFNTTLDRSQRIEQVVQMARIFSEDVAAISLFHTTQALIHIATLKGPRVVAPTALMAWDIHTWEWR